MKKKTKIQNDMKQREKKPKKQFKNVMLRQFHTFAMFLSIQYISISIQYLKYIHGAIAWNKSNFAMKASLHF